MPQPGFILISMRVAKIRTPRMAMTTVTSGSEWMGNDVMIIIDKAT